MVGQFGDGVVMGFSDRSYGNMHFKRDEREVILKNRKRFLGDLLIDTDMAVGMEEVHGNLVGVVDKNYIMVGAGFSRPDSGRRLHAAGGGGEGQENPARTISGVDGLVTDERNVYLFGTFADCLPVFFYDQKLGVIGLAHAGWRGVVANIVGKMIDAMIREYGSDPLDVLAYIGPSINKCCFEIGDDIVDQFRTFDVGEGELIIKDDGGKFVDLHKIVINQLTSVGVGEKNIGKSDECTCCLQQKYSSYRREGKGCVIQAGVIGIR